MDILLNIIGLGFIPVLIVMLAGGLSDIFMGLKEHFGFSFKVPAVSLSSVIPTFLQRYSHT